MPKIITYTGSLDTNNYNPDLDDPKNGLGILYPFQSNKEILDSTTDKIRNLKSRIMVLLNTEVGEKIMDLEFGVQLRQFVFEPISPNTTNLIKQELKHKIIKYFGNEVNINSIDVTHGEYYDWNRFSIKLNLSEKKAIENQIDIELTIQP